IVVTAGVFLLFIALALIIEAVRDGRRRSRAGSDESGADESGTEESGADESDAATHGDDERADGPVVEPEGDRVLVHGRAAGMRRGSRRSRTLADDAELTDPELVDTQLV